MITRIESELLDKFIGMPLQEVQEQIAEHGYVSNVNLPGRHIHLEGGYDPLRIQLQVEGGMIIKAEIG